MKSIEYDYSMIILEYFKDFLEFNEKTKNTFYQFITIILKYKK